MAPEERERFEAHVADCPGCEIYLEQMRATIALTRAGAELEQRPETTGLLAAFRDLEARLSAAPIQSTTGLLTRDRWSAVLVSDNRPLVSNR